MGYYMFLDRYKIATLGIEAVHGCQLKCIGCPNSLLHDKISFVSREDFLRYLRNVDVRIVSRLRPFNFGEPLLHPDLAGLLSEIPRLPYRVDCVEVSTNAQHRKYDMLREVFKTGVVNRFCVSCDGDGTPEEYERRRPPGKWEVLMEFLRKAKEYRDAYSPDTELLTRTICESDEGKRRWHDLLEPMGWTPHVRGWIILPNSQRNSGENSFKINRDQVCKYLQNYSLYVDIDGTVVPCCNHPRAAVLGNLGAQTYSEIMHGAAKGRFLAAMRSGRRDMPICGNCEIEELSPKRLRSQYRKLLRHWCRDKLGIPQPVIYND